MSETSQLTGPLMKMLADRGILAFRMQSGRVKVPGGYMQLCPKGTADVLCFHAGATWWIETKDPQGTTHRQRREDQAAFKQRVEREGHLYVICHGLAEIEAML